MGITYDEFGEVEIEPDYYDGHSKTYNEKEVIQLDRGLIILFTEIMSEIEGRKTGKKLYKKCDEVSYGGNFIDDDTYLFFFDKMREKDPEIREYNLLALAIILFNRWCNSDKSHDETRDRLWKEIRNLEEENANLRKALDGRQFQIDQVKSGEAKPARKDEITPEMVQKLYDKLKNKSAVAQELGVDRRLVDRRLKEMQMRNDKSQKQ